MLQTFVFVGYLRGISNYLEIITLSDLTHMLSMADPIVIGVETLRIDSRCFLEKECTEWININS